MSDPHFVHADNKSYEWHFAENIFIFHVLDLWKQTV